MSEPITARKPETLSGVSFTVNGNGVGLMVDISYAGSDEFEYLIAQDAKTRYYLALNDGSNRFTVPEVLLPAGEYTLYVGSLEDDELTLSNAAPKKLVVLPAPEVTVLANDDGSGSGQLQVKLPDLRYVAGLTCDGSLSGSWTHDELEEVGGYHLINDLYNGVYWLSYVGGEYDDAVSVAPEGTTASVFAEIEAWWYESDDDYPVYFESTDGPSTTLYYKGATDKIVVEFGAGVEDNRVTFKSSNTKVVTVDAVGNVTAVAKGEATITVTSVANAALKKELTVTVDPITVKSVKFAEKKLTGRAIGTFMPYTGEASFTVEVGDVPMGVIFPVTVSVTGGMGLMVRDPMTMAYETLVTAPMDGNMMSPTLDLVATAGGHYTVNVDVLGKSASLVVDVDGFTVLDDEGYLVKDTHFYKGGKLTTGWVAVDLATYQYETGAAALKGNLGQKVVSYFTADGPVLYDTKKIDKKLYLFDMGNLVVKTEGGTAVAGVYLDEDDYRTYYIEADGHLRTGWVDVGGTAYYFDPNTGVRAESAWVPTPNGKGKTWVNENGLTQASNFNGGAAVDLSTVTDSAIVVIQGKPYLFAKGAVKTGWVYLSLTQPGIVAKAKADFMVYCDPANNGMIRYESFSLKGKEYRPVNMVPGCLPLPQSALNMDQVKGVKYIMVGNGSDQWIVAADGSVAKNVLAKVYVNPDDGFQYMLAKANGTLAGVGTYGEWAVFKGKSYYFDENGYLSTEGAPTGMTVKQESGATQEVTAKLISAKKPAQGYAYYADGKKLTSVVLYDGSGLPVMLLNKSGGVVTNAVGKARKYLDVKTLAAYACGADGLVIRHPELEGGVCQYARETIGGKYYAVDLYGEVLTSAGLVAVMYSYIPYPGYPYPETYPGLANVGKNGVLSRSALAQIKVDGKTYSAWFDAEGVNEPGGSFLYRKGKSYALETVNAPVRGLAGGDTAHLTVVYKPAKAGWDEYRGVYLNKDGSAKTGWVTGPNGYKLYMLQNAYGSSGWSHVEYLQDEFVKIGGKLYCFGDYGELLTGWVKFEYAYVTEIKNGGRYSSSTLYDALFYFEPKTGAAWRAAGRRPRCLWL
ncbi:MAG: Ig-like domain-containing protein [Oscillospiraceae bacterium]|nr:Ig-like domain-containing protein [Oscillospiraceae bacterium]